MESKLAQEFASEQVLTFQVPKLLRLKLHFEFRNLVTESASLLLVRIFILSWQAVTAWAKFSCK